MDGLKFVAEIVDALAWPATLIVVLALFRKPLIDLLPQTRKVKYKEFELEFSAQVTDLHARAERELPRETASAQQREMLENLQDLAEITPNAAVLEAWEEIEASAKQLIVTRGIELDYEIDTPYKLIEITLAKEKLIDTKKIKIYADLRQLRNRVAHAPNYELTKSQVSEYIDVAVKLKVYLDDQISTAS